MRRLRRWMLRAFAAAIALALALAGGGYLWLRASLPQIEGTATLAGIAAPVAIARDAHGIPFIAARSRADALFAIGFVHAQDRLWQMEIQRRLGAGRLSEIFGPRTLAIDAFLRTLGLARAAEANWRRLDADTRAAFAAYAAGVNAYLEHRSGPLPLPFLLTDTRPEPWRPQDSLVWIKMMALDLGGNWRDEWLRARLAQKLGAERAAALFPGYPAAGPSVLADASWARELPEEVVAFLGRRAGPGLGSNGWVLSGRRSESGAPLLANDPHLKLSAPSQWYLASLAWPGQSVAGATLPGLPLPIVGRNRAIAWGFTNTNPDVQDLFVERLDPNDPGRYLTPEGPAPFIVHNETILVRGAEAVTLRVRETRHGPVISDRFEPSPAQEENTVLALAWTALFADDATARAGLALAQAANWEEFLAAARDFHGPQQTIVYADAAGHIGALAPGWVPIRASGTGAWPAPGWDGSADWIGRVPFAALPRRLDPASGAIVAANNRLVDDEYPYFLSHDWAPPYRARRIAALLDARPLHSAVSFRALQGDTRSEMAADLLPLLLARASAAEGPAAVALDLLARWPLSMTAERPEPLIFAAVERALVRTIFADELGPLFDEFWAPRPLLVERVIAGEEDWCDDVNTPEIEDCTNAIDRALVEALDELSARYGDNPIAWHWGAAHPAAMRHDVLAEMPLLGGLFDIREPHGGGAFTVNVAGYEVRDRDQPFAQTTGPGYRAIYDLSQAEVFWAVQNLGQSENPFSPHYRDLHPYWMLERYVRVPLGAPEKDSRWLTLLPAGATGGAAGGATAGAAGG